MHPAHIVHLSRSLTLSDLLAKIGQADVGAELLDQCRFPILPRAPALVAGEPDEVAGMFSEGERTIHVAQFAAAARKHKAKRRPDHLRGSRIILCFTVGRVIPGKYRRSRVLPVKHFVCAISTIGPNSASVCF